MLGRFLAVGSMLCLDSFVEVVAVFAHRDASLVWALLGVLKTGAVFSILDPAYPAARLLERAYRRFGMVGGAASTRPAVHFPSQCGTSTQ